MKWFGYTDRTSEQVVESVKTRIKSGNEGVLSEISDFSESNPFMKLIEIWGNLIEQVNYYIDNYVREFFISKAKKFSSMVGFAEMFDYRIHGAVPALGKVKFYITSIAETDIIIPIGTVISTTDGIKFITLSHGVITAGQLSCTISAKQYEQAETINTVSTGVKDMTISMPSNTAENSVQVFVNGVQFVESQSLYDRTDKKAKAVGYFEVGLGLEGSYISQILIDGVNIIAGNINYSDPVSTATAIATAINSINNVFGIIATSNSKMVVLQASEFGTLLNDKIIQVVVSGTLTISNISNFSGGSEGIGANVFVLSPSSDGNMKLTFGGGINGAIPGTGLPIVINYYVSAGLSGNVGTNKVTVIVSELDLPNGVTLLVKNESNFQGGNDIESIESIRKSIPAAISSRHRTVTKQDFEDIVSLIPGVLANSVDYKKDKNLRIYVYPFGGGIAGKDFLNYVYANVVPKMAVGYDPDVLPSGEVKAIISVTAYAKVGYSKEALKTSLNAAILSVLGWEKAIVKETKFISDIYNEMETIPGITGTSIDRFVLVPYPEPVDLNETQLNWTISVTSIPSVIKKWLIVFTNETTFAVYCNNAYQGTFEINIDVVLSDVTIKINSSYSANKRWQFYTYPDYSKSGGVISLAENSAIVTYTEDIDITIIGGV